MEEKRVGVELTLVSTWSEAYLSGPEMVQLLVVTTLGKVGLDMQVVEHQERAEGS